MEKKLSELTSLDIYLNGMSPEKREQVLDGYCDNYKLQGPLKSWGIFSEHFRERLKSYKIQSELDQLKLIGKNYNWVNDLEDIFTDVDYDAIILTNEHQEIQWVSEGFTDMTGYSKKYAMEKTPRFLQGSETRQDAKTRIRENLKKGIIFEEEIINHKKDGTVYTCHVQMFPLKHLNKTYFLALETEL